MATRGGGGGTGPERAWAAELPTRGEVALDREESSHLVRSRRVREGEPVVLFDGRGTTRLARLVRADPRAAVLCVEGPAPDREPRREIVLGVAPPELGRTDRLVASLAELGVARWVPVLAARTPAERARQLEGRGSRWHRLAREAAKVSGRSRLLTVGAPALVGHFVATAPRLIVLDPDPTLAPLPSLLPPAGDLPWVLVGPEGGFTDGEREEMRARGAHFSRLGSTVLRVETAAVVAAGILACA